MNRLLFFIFCMLLFVDAKGQSSYSEAIYQGDTAYDNKQYKTAINKYFAAEAFDPSKKDEVKARVNRVFDKIEALRQEAEELRKRANNATRSAILNEYKAKEALSKAKKFISQHFFYDDKFALEIYNQEGGSDYKFIFIDTNGMKVEQLGEWIRATQFNAEDGFARVYAGVYTDFESDFLLDTTGQTYLAAYDLQGILRVKNYNRFLFSADSGFGENAYGIEAFVIDRKDFLDVDIKDGTSLIDSILTISSLKILLIKESDLPDVDHLASNLDKLPNLEYLTLLNLKVLPPQIGNLGNLKSLNLSSNELSALPKEIGQLKNLTNLNLPNNQLVFLPNEIGELKNLTTLNLENNKLESLPFEMGKLTNLESLRLGNMAYDYYGHNKLVHLPTSIGQLKNLRTLELYGNELTDLPREIGDLKNLTTLYLSSNKLTNLPPEIGWLDNLASLYLNNNQLTGLPNEIGKLKNLITLDLSGNKIPKIEIEKIKKLLPNCELITD